MLEPPAPEVMEKEIWTALSRIHFTLLYDMPQLFVVICVDWYSGQLGR